MFNSVISSEGLSLVSGGICVIVAIILGIFISFIHMKTSKYSKNFVITLAILPLLVAIVMFMVNGNLGTSIAIVGAFSLVRFRSIPGTSREIASVFWAMAIGLAIGMGQVVFGSLVTFIIGILLVLFYKTNFGNDDMGNKILTIVIPENLDYDTVMDDVFVKYLDNYELLRVKTTNLGSLFELNYNIKLKKNIKMQEFINDLRVRNGNLKICIHKDTVEEML